MRLPVVVADFRAHGLARARQGGDVFGCQRWDQAVNHLLSLVGSDRRALLRGGRNDIVDGRVSSEFLNA
jgi:hypothetical protein